MLKITKGLKPYIEDGISTYTDAKDNQYVRVRADGEDFGIASRDYVKDGRKKFTWNEAMRLMKEEGMTMFTKEQVELYKARHIEINSKLKEIGGKAFKSELYWTATEHDVDEVWSYWGSIGSFYSGHKNAHSNVRPIINL